MTAVIETNDLGKQYGRKWALRDCTLSIPEGKEITRRISKAADR